MEIQWGVNVGSIPGDTNATALGHSDHRLGFQGLSPAQAQPCSAPQREKPFSSQLKHESSQGRLLQDFSCALFGAFLTQHPKALLQYCSWGWVWGRGSPL